LTIIDENLQTVVSSGHDMVNGSGIFNSQWARHDCDVIPIPTIRQTKLSIVGPTLSTKRRLSQIQNPDSAEEPHVIKNKQLKTPPAP